MRLPGGCDAGGGGRAGRVGLGAGDPGGGASRAGPGRAGPPGNGQRATGYGQLGVICGCWASIVPTFTRSCPLFLKFSTCAAAEDLNRRRRPTCDLLACRSRSRSRSCSGFARTLLRRCPRARYLGGAARVGRRQQHLACAMQHADKYRLRVSAPGCDDRLHRPRGGFDRCHHFFPDLRSKDHLQGRLFRLVRADGVRSHSQHRDVHHFCVRQVAGSGAAGGGPAGHWPGLFSSAVCARSSSGTTASSDAGPVQSGRAGGFRRGVDPASCAGEQRSSIRFPGCRGSSDPRRRQRHPLQLVWQRKSRQCAIDSPLRFDGTTARVLHELWYATR
jgi:hypothetical protein